MSADNRRSLLFENLSKSLVCQLQCLKYVNILINYILCLHCYPKNYSLTVNNFSYVKNKF